MRARHRWLAALALVTGAALTGCAGGDIQEANPTAEGGGDCGTVDMAVSPWVGYEASAHVVGYVATSELGCQVEYKTLKEEIAWQGFGSGDVDVIIENWEHPT